MSRSGDARRVVMLLENQAYPADVRVRCEAESLTAAGYRVTVVAPRARGQARQEDVGGVAVRRYRLPRTPATPPGLIVEHLAGTVQMHLGAVRELVAGARTVHLHNPPDTLAAVGLLARALGRRVVFDQHDLAPELGALKSPSAALERLLRWLEFTTFRVANLVLVPNDSHRELATTRGRKRSDEVVVVRNGPRRATLTEAAPALRELLEGPRLVFLGSMEAQDGVELLPALLTRLREVDGISATLTLIGEGSRRAALERAFATAGLADVVTFTGHVPHAEVPRLLAEADICLDPAPANRLNHRSTMIKIAEYMAAARPVVAFRLRETERTTAGTAALAECGDLCAFAQQIGRLARRPALRLELARRGHERARELVWERSESALLAGYARLHTSTIDTGSRDQ